MADERTQKLARFYEQCQSKGYTDMADEVQKLKAKVIASDLGLNYGNIGKLYQNAAEAYDKINAEKERIAVNGEQILSLNSRYHVFRREDGSCYVQAGEERCDGTPSFSVVHTYYKKYTYHEATATYNAVSMNGFTTGWVDNQGDYFSNKDVDSGRGLVRMSYGDNTVTITDAEPVKAVCEAFKRDSAFTKWVKEGKIVCKSGSSSSEYYWRALKQYEYTHNVVEMMNEESYSKVVEQLWRESCEEIATLLQRIVDGDNPPTDEEFYTAAMKLAQEGRSADINKAIETLETIEDYKDAAQKIELLKTRYEEILQKEKEESILQKEKKTKQIKKTLLFTAAAVLLCTLVTLAAVKLVIPESRYKKASALLESGQYLEARSAFAQLGDYKDSRAMRTEASLAIKYAEAEDLLANNDRKAAMKAFLFLGSYRDSEQRAAEIRESMNREAYEEAEAAFLSGDYLTAAEKFKALKDYSDSAARAEEALETGHSLRYAEAEEKMAAFEYQKAAELYEALEDYRDSRELAGECRYMLAKQYYDEGNLAAAHKEYLALGTYKDSRERLVFCADAGQICYFGRRSSCFAPGKITDGEKLYEGDIPWYVLKREKNKVQLICGGAIEMSLHTSADVNSIAWKKSDLCAYLNDKALKNSFSNEEQKRIILSETRDKIYILEASEYQSAWRIIEENVCPGIGDYIWTRTMPKRQYQSNITLALDKNKILQTVYLHQPNWRGFAIPVIWVDISRFPALQ